MFLKLFQELKFKKSLLNYKNIFQNYNPENIVGSIFSVSIAVYSSPAVLPLSERILFSLKKFVERW